MDNYKIISPSYKRSEIAISHKLFKGLDFSYIVREEEKEIYQRKIPGVNILAIPSGRVKNIAETRNYIMSEIDGERIVQVDDDLKRICFYFQKKYIDLCPNGLDAVIKNHFRMIEDLGTVLWGMNIVQDPKAYRQHRPYNFDKVILGPFFGYIKNKIRYDENLSLKEDYDYFLQVIKEYGFALRANFLMYFCDHFKLPGGCQDYRSAEKEKSQMKYLMKKWGSDIVRYNERNPDSVNMRIRL